MSSNDIHKKSFVGAERFEICHASDEGEYGNLREFDIRIRTHVNYDF